MTAGQPVYLLVFPISHFSSENQSLCPKGPDKTGSENEKIHPKMNGMERYIMQNKLNAIPFLYKLLKPKKSVLNATWLPWNAHLCELSGLLAAHGGVPASSEH